MALGWLIRGIHRFGSQAMIVLLAIHLAQVVLAAAYRPPREVNWWFGLVLLFLTLGSSVTGNLLPWDDGRTGRPGSRPTSWAVRR